MARRRRRLACHESEKLVADVESAAGALLPAIALSALVTIAFTVLRQLQTLYLSLPIDAEREPSR